MQFAITSSDTDRVAHPTGPTFQTDNWSDAQGVELSLTPDLDNVDNTVTLMMTSTADRRGRRGVQRPQGLLHGQHQRRRQGRHQAQHRRRDRPRRHHPDRAAGTLRHMDRAAQHGRPATGNALSRSRSPAPIRSAATVEPRGNHLHHRRRRSHRHRKRDRGADVIVTGVTDGRHPQTTWSSSPTRSHRRDLCRGQPLPSP